ncbi:hypothetical protein LEP1GSC190_02380 [Leptospira mayottensis 200901116]|nr:hypothetical protein LEP1GSC190_02380 [Leptospira mayottensis 200901116]
MYFHLDLTLALKYKNRFGFFIQAFKDVLNKCNVYWKVAFLKCEKRKYFGRGRKYACGLE